MKSFFQHLKKWFFLCFLAGVFFLFYYYDFHHYLHLETLKEYQSIAEKWTDEHYLSAMMLYVLVFIVLIGCGVPCATILTLLGGFLFGILAFVYAEVGTTFGGLILFLAVRTSIGKSITAKSNGWIKKMEAGFKQNAFHYLLMLRLVPVFPCGVSNVAAGALNVSIRTYLSATALGIAPSTLIYVLVGRGLDKLFSSETSLNLNHLLLTPSFLLPLIGLALLSFFPLIYKTLKNS